MVGRHAARDTHTPLPVSWLCRICAAPWPCGPAKIYLLRAYRECRLSLFIGLAACLHEAMRDLAELHGPDAPNPQVLQSRFLGWLPRHSRTIR